MSQMQDKNSLLAKGTMLQNGKYRVDECIASGGFGNTYVITNVSFGKRFAMKEFFIKGVAERLEDTKTVSVPIAENQSLFSSQKDKFRREALFLSELNNEHIVRVQDFFEENGTAYYVMDYISGESLRDYMRRTNSPLDEAFAMNIFRQLLEALRQTHKKNILHLDIKPANIIITKEGKVVLIDFGASKQVETDSGHTLTTTSLAYTPGYAPTEQITQNKKRIGAWTDIYSLGATMYNILTNERPPSCDDLIDEDAFQLPSSVGDQMKQLIRWMMQPSIKKRPQSIVEIEYKLKPQRRDANVWVRADATLADTILPDKDFYNELTVQQKPIRNNITERITPQILIPKTTLQNPIIQNLISNMVHIEGGTFTMGATSEQGSDADSNEEPAHQVTLSSFFIGKYEVTQEEWEAIMGSNPSYFKGAKRPVELVSWNDCQNFIRRLNQNTGLNFRLPTEAEWEYAARGGNRSEGCKFSGSNAISDVAWYEGNSNNKTNVFLKLLSIGETHNVGIKSSNELGLHDMSGNVLEWCSDRYSKYSSSSQTNPQGPSSGSRRVIRGGSWNSIARDCRVSYRLSFASDGRSSNLGLRLAL